MTSAGPRPPMGEHGPTGSATQVARPPQVDLPAAPGPAGSGGPTGMLPKPDAPAGRSRQAAPEPQLKLPAVPTLICIGLLVICATAAAIGLLGPIIGVQWTIAAILAVLVLAFLVWCYVKFGRAAKRAGRAGRAGGGRGLFGGGRSGGSPLSRLFGGGRGSGGGRSGGPLGRLFGGGGKGKAGLGGAGTTGKGKGLGLGRLFGGSGKGPVGGGKSGGKSSAGGRGSGGGSGGGKSSGGFGSGLGRLFGGSGKGSGGGSGKGSSGGGSGSGSTGGGKGSGGGGKPGDPLGLGRAVDRVKKVGAQQVGGRDGDLPRVPATGRGGGAYEPGQADGRGGQTQLDRRVGSGQADGRGNAGGTGQRTTGGTMSGRRRDRASIQGHAADARDDIEKSRELSAMVGRLAAQAEGNQPVPRSIPESMRQVERLLKAESAELAEGQRIYKSAHAEDDDRDRAPRVSDRVEQKADVSRNVRDN